MISMNHRIKKFGRLFLKIKIKKIKNNLLKLIQIKMEKIENVNNLNCLYLQVILIKLFYYFLKYKLLKKDLIKLKEYNN